MAHEHQRNPAEGANTRRLALTLALVLVYMAVELIGGLLARSLALIADVGHMLSDAGALGLTLFAMHVAGRPATAQRTFGSYRAEILAALANGAMLVAIALFIFVEAFERFRSPPAVQGPLMLVVASGGLLVNAGGLWLLRGSHEGNLNMRGAWLHVMTDALGSVQAIAAAGLIWAYGWNWVDPLASVLIGLVVIYSSWSLIRQAVAVLMESAPGHIDVDEVRASLLELPHVTDVHDLHVWTITSGFVALSAHVTCPGVHDHGALLRSAREMLAKRFGIRHTTIQIDRDRSCGSTDHQLPPR